MKIFACLLALCVVGALAAPEKSEEPKRDKRGYLTGAHAYPGYGYSGLGYSGLGYSGLGYSGLGYSGLGYSGLGYAGYGGYGGGYLGYAGHGGYLGYAAPVATKVIAAPAVSYGAYPSYGGHYVNSYAAPHALYGGYGAGW